MEKQELINYKLIGRKIGRFRKLLNYRQAEVAEHLGISVNSYGNMERGVEKFSLLRIIQLCEFFNILPGEILDDCTYNLACQKKDHEIKHHRSLEQSNLSIDILQKECYYLHENDIKLLIDIAKLLENK